MKTLLSLLLILLIFVSNAFAQGTGKGNLDDLFNDSPSFLPVDQAFAFDFAQDGERLTIRFSIADGYYLYRKQFKQSSKNAVLGEPVFPQGEIIEDEFFGESEVYFGQVSYEYPIESSEQDGVVKVRFQGCAKAGLCYPPTTKVIYLNAVGSAASAEAPTETASDNDTVSQQFSLADRLLAGDDYAVTLLLFFALGIGLAFTPCVFPMYPILSSIVFGGNKQLSSVKALRLSLWYVQGMAITYSLIGLVVASAGVQFQAALQHPVILSVFIALFLVLAASMFGAFELQLPSSWQSRMHQLSNEQKGGSAIGVFIMGALSGLVASPCTTAPLTGILLFIAQSGDLWLGFLSLYVLSLGMGVPLVLFAVTGGKLLPKAGNWMNVVKVTFGFMLLVVALLFVERMWVNALTTLLWSALGLAAFSYYSVVNAATALSFAKGVRTMLIFIGLFASALYGASYFMSSLLTLTPQASSQAIATHSTEVTHPRFVVVKDLSDFDAKLGQANAAGKSVMVDLYADWCVACKEFEKYTFPDAAVITALENTVWMQIDLTDNTPTNLAFQQAFNVLGLPTILFFDANGDELTKARVTGFMKADAFAAHVNKALKRPD